jgi:hypothetical protein
MAHFAKVNQGIVVDVIVAEPEFFNGFVDTSPGEWIQTSYNTRGGIHYEPESNTPSTDQSKALRKNYAGIGYAYDAQRDAFIPTKPYHSWVLNEETCLWESVVPYPDNDGVYYWDEGAGLWSLMEKNE